jgi:hypothetical protein
MDTLIRLVESSEVVAGPVQVNGLAAILAIVLIAAPVCIWAGVKLTRKFSALFSQAKTT